MKKEQSNISFYVRPSKRKGGMDTDDDDDDMYEPQTRIVLINNGKIDIFFEILIENILYRTSSNEILSNV